MPCGDLKIVLCCFCNRKHASNHVVGSRNKSSHPLLLPRRKSISLNVLEWSRINPGEIAMKSDPAFQRKITVLVKGRWLQVELEIDITAIRYVASFQCRAVDHHSDAPLTQMLEIDQCRGTNNRLRFWHNRSEIEIIW